MDKLSHPVAVSIAVIATFVRVVPTKLHRRTVQYGDRWNYTMLNTLKGVEAMNVIVGEWLQLTKDERLRVLEYVVCEQKKKNAR